MKVVIDIDKIMKNITKKTEKHIATGLEYALQDKVERVEPALAEYLKGVIVSNIEFDNIFPEEVPFREAITTL